MFKGKCDNLKGNVFDCSGYRPADQFIVTKEVIENYIGAKFEHGGDIQKTVKKLARITIPKPNDMPDDANKTEEFIMKKQVNLCMNCLQKLEDNIQKLCSLAWGQCAELLQAKLEALQDFKSRIKDNHDGLELLKSIQVIMCEFEDNRCTHENLCNAWRSYCALRQKPEDTLMQHIDKFNNAVDVLEQCRATFGLDEIALQQEGFFNSPEDQQMHANVVIHAKKKLLSFACLHELDNNKCAKLKEELSNDCT